MAVNALSGNFGRIVNCITTNVELTNPFTQATLDSRGIWDTGATNSVITKAAAGKLGLLAVEKAFVRGVHGVKEVNVYYVGITLDNKNISVKARVTECDELSGDNSIGMLIGMNIITMGDFCVSNYQGNTAMTFRVPSVETVDYVREISEYNKYLKIHREQLRHGIDKCPCGSGKKYEDCHGKSKYSGNK
ncbi:MAG: SEC-C domain-containing protein [Prevotella sp.]|nr:SEC-C domain-containing protein [Prevotella sp.]